MLTVTARDAAGNTSTDTLTVTYTPPDTTQPDGDDHDADEQCDPRVTATTPLTLGGRPRTTSG